MSRFATIESRAVLLPHDDIDTDQIIPARFLKVTSREGLGVHLFQDWRYQADGTPKPDFPLNAPGAWTRPVSPTSRAAGRARTRRTRSSSQRRAA